jgi:phage tail protein X
MDYVTRQNDILDDVVFRYYGDLTGRAVERVLEANRGLADFGPVLPAGVTISLPDQPVETPENNLTRLWD